MNTCKCGCGEQVPGGTRYVPGHDAVHLWHRKLHELRQVTGDHTTPSTQMLIAAVDQVISQRQAKKTEVPR